MSELKKNSPLYAVYGKYLAETSEVNQWVIASSFGNESKEKTALQQDSVLADWSHIGKIYIRGAKAAEQADLVDKQASSLEVGQTLGTKDQAVLCLLKDHFLILCSSEKEEGILKKLNDQVAKITILTGAQGCLVLAGPRREQVMQRATAMNLRNDKYPPGSVVQSSTHTITTTIYRTSWAEIMICDQTYCQSLFDAFMDFQSTTQMLPTGLNVVPVSFNKENA